MNETMHVQYFYYAASEYVIKLNILRTVFQQWRFKVSQGRELHGHKEQTLRHCGLKTGR